MAVRSPAQLLQNHTEVLGIDRSLDADTDSPEFDVDRARNDGSNRRPFHAVILQGVDFLRFGPGVTHLRGPSH